MAKLTDAERAAFRAYAIDIDAAALADLEGLPLGQARAIVEEEHRSGRFGFRGLPADAERLALAGDVLAEGQVVFRFAGPDGVVDVVSPIEGVFEGEEGGPFAVRHLHDTDSAETGWCSGCGRTDLRVD